jgi:hypothetical protein
LNSLPRLGLAAIREGKIMRKTWLWLLGFLFLWGLWLSPYPAGAGTVETRIKDTVIQNFLENLFPVVLTRQIDLLGMARIPVTVQLSHPRSRLVDKGTSEPIPCLQVTMEYELRNGADGSNPVRGELTGDLLLSVSPDSEYLVLTPAETYLPVAPGIQINLRSILKPARFPLFKNRPMTVNGQNLEAQFFGMELRVQNGDLVVAGDVRFEKK